MSSLSDSEVLLNPWLQATPACRLYRNSSGATSLSDCSTSTRAALGILNEG